MRIRMRVAGPAVVLALSVVGAAHAGEPEPPVRRVWLEVKPWTCMRELPSFARHVELACDAMGGACEVARSEEQATERAILGCEDPPPWTLRLGGLDGGDALLVTLYGDREQRLRKAAMWIAGARPEHALELHAPAPVVVRVAAARPAPAPMAFPWPEPAEPPPVKAEPKRPRNRGGLALSGFIGASTGRSSGAAGVRADLVFPLPKALQGQGLYLGASFSYASLGEETWTVGYREGEAFLAGVTAGWGAPFDHRWFGLSLGAGAGVTQGTVSWEPRGAATGYGRFAMTVQVPIKVSAVRPTVTLSGMTLTDQLGQDAQTVMIETGLAWQAW